MIRTDNWTELSPIIPLGQRSGQAQLRLREMP